MTITDRARVLVDWNDDGVFTPSSPNVNELPNLIVDPYTMQSVLHENVDTAYIKHWNFLPGPTYPPHWDCRVTTHATINESRMYKTTQTLSRYIWRLRLVPTDGGNTNYWVYIGDDPSISPKALPIARTDNPALSGTLPGVFPPVGNSTVNVKVRGIGGTISNAMRVHLRKYGVAATGVYVATTGVFNLDGTTPGFPIDADGWIDVVLPVTGHDGSQCNVLLQMNNPTVDVENFFEVSDVGVYAADPGRFYGNINEPGVWPLTEDISADPENIGVGAVEVTTLAGTHAGYRWTPQELSLHELDPLGVYTFVVWAKSSSTLNFLPRLVKVSPEAINVAVINTYPAVELNNTDWTQIAMTFVCPPSLDAISYGMELVKDNSATNTTLTIAGWMIVKQADAPLGENLLPSQENNWFWKERLNPRGIRFVEETHPFGDYAWEVTNEAEVGNPLLPTGVNTFIVDKLNDEVTPIFPGLLENDAVYLLEYWQRFRNNVTAQPQVISDDGEVVAQLPVITITDVQRPNYDKWVRRSAFFRAGHDVVTGDPTVFALQNIGPLDVGSIITGISLRKVTTYPNRIDTYPFTGVTDSSTGTANGNGEDGNYGSHARANITPAGTGEWTLGGVGDWLVTGGETYMFYADAVGDIPYDIQMRDNNGLGDWNLGPFTEHIAFHFTPDAAATSIRIRFRNISETNIIENLWVVPVSENPAYASPQVPTMWNEGGEVYQLTGYDDITPYVLSVRTNSGKNEFNTPMAFEGTAEITLNNDSKIFSPSNTASPLYGFLRENLKMQIQVKFDTDWLPVWTGWTHNFEVEAGRQGTRKATLTGRQGFFRLREGEFVPSVLEETTLEEVVAYLVAHSGWFTLSNDLQTYTNTARVGVNAYIRDNSDIFEIVDEGIYPLEFIGDRWNREVSIGTALEDVLKLEGGHLWMSRSGLLTMRNREYFIGRELGYDYAVSLDTDVDSASYYFGQDIINRVEVKVKPKEPVEGVEIWKTKAPLELKASKDNKATEKTFELDFKFEEEHPKTITKIYDIGEGSTIEVFTTRTNARRKQVFKPMSDEQVKKFITLQIEDGEGRKAFTLKNTFRKTVYVTVTLLGDYVEAGEDETYVYEDLASLEQTKTVYKHTANLNAATSEEEAESYAQALLLRQAAPYPEFPNIRFVLRSDQDWLNAKNWTIGTVLSVSETQTSEQNVAHAIIQENFNIDVGQIEVEYSLAFLDNNDYVVVGADPQFGKIIYV